MRVLVVEDHASLAREIAYRLRREHMAVDVARDGAEALQKAGGTEYDVVILDRDLPVVHGDDVCRELASQGEGPRILMLTAARGIDDVVEGLGIGADDYLSKPFAMVELVARIRTLSRRATTKTAPILSVGSLIVDPSTHKVSRDGRLISLSPKEFGVLEVLAANPGRVISAEHLLEKVWDEYADSFTNAVRVTLVTLRRKLGEPPLIETVKKVGYRLTTEEKS